MRFFVINLTLHDESADETSHGCYHEAMSLRDFMRAFMADVHPIVDRSQYRDGSAMSRLEFVALDRNTPPKRLWLIALNVGERSFSWLVQNPITPPDVLAHIARKTVNEETLYAIVRHPRVDADLLLYLSSKNKTLRILSVSHPSFPRDLALSILNTEHEDDDVRNAALIRILTDSQLADDEKIRVMATHDKARAVHAPIIALGDSLPMMLKYLPPYEEV